MLPKVLLILINMFCVQLFVKSQTYRRNFATKSRYPIYNDDMKIPHKCSPLHLNMVFRHGTRYPGKKDIKGMSELAAFIKKFDDKERNDMKSPWVNRFINGDKYLAKVGAEELYNISKRIYKKYHSLFVPKYSSEQHYFVSTMTPRASQSASAFAFGLFEGTGYLGLSKFQPVAITTTNLTEPLLRFFDTCSEYKQKVSKNKQTSLAEFYKFRDGPEMTHLKYVLAGRLNITDHSSLTTDHIQHMFLACAYELAIYGKGHWCSVLEDSDLDVIEYLYDIKNYWKRGYGHRINYEMSCLLLRNLTESIENVIQSLNASDLYTKAIFHFSHAETIIPLMCLMGLFNDNEPLLASSYEEQNNRLFKTSNIAPFSGNIAVVLLSCKNGVEEHDSLNVQVLVNEISVALPCCNAKELCPLDEFRTCFGNISTQCDFSKVCSNQNPLNHNEL